MFAVHRIEVVDKDDESLCGCCTDWGMLFLGLGMRLAASFHPKASKWIKGRINWAEKLPSDVPQEAFRVWIHCASLGEFEQVRNLIEALKKEVPHCFLYLTFYSPSGYEVRKNYALADWVGYLPEDHPGTARKWAEAVRPEVVFFVKYELWLYHLREIKERNIPAALIAARLRPIPVWQRSFRAWMYQKGLNAFQQVFAQDQANYDQMIQWVSQNQVQIGGDTRYDRVAASKARFQPIPTLESFKRNRLCIVCGSTWPEDEAILFQAMEQLSDREDLCWVIAPHEIHQDRIQRDMSRFGERSLAYSQREDLEEGHDLLWIDNIGMLAQLYGYADVAYVGGAWGPKVHNILEAVGFGVPVLFGPNHQNLPEVPALLEAEACFELKAQDELLPILRLLLDNEARRDQIRSYLLALVAERQGATEQVLRWCQSLDVFPNRTS